MLLSVVQPGSLSHRDFKMAYQHRLFNGFFIAIVTALSLYLIAHALFNFEFNTPILEAALGLCLLLACLLFVKFVRQGNQWQQPARQAERRVEAPADEPGQKSALPNHDIDLARAMINSYPTILVVVFDSEFRCKLLGGKMLGQGGFPTIAMEGKTIWETLPPEFWRGTESRFHDALAGKVTSQDLSLVDSTFRSDILPIHDAQGDIFAGFMLMRDLSERKRVERRERELEDLYRRAIAAAGGVLYRKDERDWTYTFMDEGIVNLTGYTAEEMTPDLWANISQIDIFHGALAGLTFDEAMHKVKSGEVDAWTEDSMIITRQGEERWIADTSVEIRNEAGHSIGSIGLLQDITDRKRTEEVLRKAKDVAENAARAKAEFLANMSHEIRTPLNAIIGMTSLLLDTPLIAEQRDFTDTIRTSGNALLTLINDILDFSKIEFGKLELEMAPFDLVSGIEEILDLFAPYAAQKELELTYSIDPETPTHIVGDPSRLRQILTNLVGNAVKFTAHGEVAVTVESQQQADHLLFHFSVRDTGIGILEEDRVHLFESFSQVDASTTRRYGGTGLGLAISRHLSELMGGRMWLESQAGIGSTFHFTIQTPMPVQQPKLDRATLTVLRGKRVLVVDDYATSREVLLRQLRAWQMIPTAADSGAAALERLNAGEIFDVALVDRQMPQMDGLALAVYLHRHPKGTALPLILLSPLGNRSAQAKELDFVALLTKPVKQAQLFATLNNIFTKQPTTPTVEPVSDFDPTLAQRLPLRILLAEDNMVNQKVAQYTLARLGYRIDVAANGVEVLSALQRQPYDVILMDVQMPEMDGLETTRVICAQWPKWQRPYIVAMTAHALTGDYEKCIAAGMDNYISKPIRLDKLVAALTESQQSSAQKDRESKVEEVSAEEEAVT